MPNFSEFPTSATPIDTSKLISFSLNKFGLYSVSITARCEHDEELSVCIDELELREIPETGFVQHWKIPPAWNGTELKGLAKTVVFLLPLNQYDHTLNFIAKNSATIEKIEVQLWTDPHNIQFQIEQEAEEGDRRPWYTFAVMNLPIQDILVQVSVFWHLWDGDDVKVIVDNAIEPNPDAKKMKDWVWSAKFWQVITGTKKEQKVFTKNLPQGVHYIEFWADKTPTLHQVGFDLGNIQLKRIPTMNDPEWTGDFADDTDQMILARALFAEARNQSKEVMSGIAWAIKNRLLAKQSYFGLTYHEIILKNDGIHYQFSSFNPKNENFQILINPLKTRDKITKTAWINAYEAARGVVNGSISDTTSGAVFFHSKDFSQKEFITKKVPGAIFVKQIGDFLFYKSPK